MRRGAKLPNTSSPAIVRVVHDVTLGGFSLRYDGRAARPPLTLLIDCSAICRRAEPLIDIVLPNGRNCRSRRLSVRHQQLPASGNHPSVVGTLHRTATLAMTS